MAEEIVKRDTVKEQLSRLGMSAFFSDEEATPKGEKVKVKKKKEPKKVVSSSKKYEKKTKTTKLPQKVYAQKSTSPSGAEFLISKVSGLFR